MRPHPVTLLPPLLALLTLTHTQSTNDFLTTMPPCWQSCFQAQFPNCPNQNTTDTATLCVCGTALAQPSMFSSLISCVTNQCNAHADPTAPLDAWATACNNLQHPLPSGEVQSAERALATGTASTSTGTTMTTSTTASSSHTAGATGSGGGSSIDLTNMASRQRERSMLGLMVGVVAGVVWF